MRLALDLARKGLGRTSPNPCVGAILVKSGKILGQGWHKKAGGPHAEIAAIRQARRRGRRLRGATLYVTLEPCCTHGRTPPCTEAILREGLARVVVGCSDPNPKHSGRAFKILRRAGVNVTHGVLKNEATRLNRSFNHWIRTGQPWVLAKAALTLDGFLALPPGQGRWITGPAARRDVHLLRSHSDAILIGAGTARIDNPRLTVRGIKNARQPLRVIVTRSGKLPRSLHLLRDARRHETVVFKKQTWPRILSELGRRGVTQLLVEGGAQVFRDLARKKLIHEVALYYAPKILPEGQPDREFLPRAAFLTALRLQKPRLEYFGRDLKLTGWVKQD